MLEKNVQWRQQVKNKIIDLRIGFENVKTENKNVEKFNWKEFSKYESVGYELYFLRVIITKCFADGQTIKLKFKKI